MKSQKIKLSDLKLDIRNENLRIPTRPTTLRDAEFEDNFDFETLFYDVFWNANCDEVICIGPPLLNLFEDLDLEFVDNYTNNSCTWRRELRRNLELIIISVSTHCKSITARTRYSEFNVSPEPNMSDLFSDKRVAFTLSKNNDLQWIKDWAKFYVKVHACDAILFYDNGSDLYDISEIEQAIRSVTSGLTIAVISWPFKYGVDDWRLETGRFHTDSRFCQEAMIEHARYRFLPRSRSVLNVDVDELVICTDSESVFQLAEQSDTAYVSFFGYWVENYTSSKVRKPRHKDFYYLKYGSKEYFDPKWAAVPSRTPDNAQWNVHAIYGASRNTLAIEDCSIRHFKGINTNWHINRKDQKKRLSPVSQKQLEQDGLLKRTLETVFENDQPVKKIDNEEFPKQKSDVQKAYWFRIKAGRLLRSGDVNGARAAVASAIALQPDACSFLEFAENVEKRTEARKQPKTVAILQSNNLEYGLNLALLAAEQGNWTECQSLLQGLRNHSKSFEEIALQIHTDAALFGYIKSSTRRLVREFCDNIKEDDHWRFYIGSCQLFAIEEFHSSLEFIEKAQNNFDLWIYDYLKAFIYRETKDRKNEFETWQRFLDLRKKPKSVASRFPMASKNNFGRIYKFMDAKDFINASNDISYPLRRMAYIKKGEGLLKDALELFFRSVLTNPENLISRYALGCFLDEQGDVSGAAFEFKTINQKIIDRIETRKNFSTSNAVYFSHTSHIVGDLKYIDLLIRLENFSLAKSILDRSAKAVDKYNTKNGELFRKLAVCYRDFDDPSASLHFLRKAIGLLPENAAFRSLESDILNRLGRPSEARNAADIAESLNSENQPFSKLVW